MRDRLTVTPKQYRIVAYLTLGALMLIVLTGAGVQHRGLWPWLPRLAQVRRQRATSLSTHALIEFGNRAISGLVGVMTVD